MAKEKAAPEEPVYDAVISREDTGEVPAKGEQPPAADEKPDLSVAGVMKDDPYAVPD